MHFIIVILFSILTKNKFLNFIKDLFSITHNCYSKENNKNFQSQVLFYCRLYFRN